MAEHEPCIGATDDWYTPPEIFDALDLAFDLDPCSPGPGHWVLAAKIYTKADEGLAQPWSGLVFVKRPLAAQIPRARKRHRDRARLHELGLASPMGGEG